MALSKYILFSDLYGRWLESLSIYWKIRKKRRSKKYVGKLSIEISVTPDQKSEYGWVDLAIKTKNCLYAQSPIYGMVNKFGSQKCIWDCHVVHLSPVQSQNTIEIEFFGSNHQHEKREIDIVLDTIKILDFAQNLKLDIDKDVTSTMSKLTELSVYIPAIKDVAVIQTDEFRIRLDDLKIANVSMLDFTLEDFNVNNYKPQL